ncbi:MAG: hypothetical protein R2701_10020 [Acidimicrobiales bacterium]
MRLLRAYFTRGCGGAYGDAALSLIGRIRWAGAECSPVWNGYMEGAVRRRAARRAPRRGA